MKDILERERGYDRLNDWGFTVALSNGQPNNPTERVDGRTGWLVSRAFGSTRIRTRKAQPSWPCIKSGGGVALRVLILTSE